MNRWPPDPMSVDYQGPYPVWEIRQARKVLIRCLEDHNNQSLQYVLPKIGIDPMKGCVIPSPLLPIVRNPSIRFANGHPSPNFMTRSPSQLFAPRCILPLMGSPANRQRLYTPQTIENQHFLRHEEDHPIFPETDQPVVFNSLMKNFPYNRPLLPTPVDISFESKVRNDFEEPTDNFSNYYHSSAAESENGLVSFGNQNCLDHDNDTSVELDGNKSTLGSFKSEGCTGSPVDVKKMIDIDISSDTLRQILAMVGKIKPINAEQEVDHATVQQESEQNVVLQTELNVTLECDTTTEHNSKNQSFEEDTSTKPCSMKMYSRETNSESNSELHKSKDFTHQNIDTTEIKTSDEKIEQSKVLDVFKCDYCQRSTQSVDQMQNHLTSSKHLTASKYLGTYNQQGHLEPRHIEQILAVKNPKQANSRGHVIACPNCRTVFSNVFTCSQHNKYEHGSTEGYYAICPVIHSEFLTLQHHPECSKCNQRFASWTELNEHWISNQSHSLLTPLLSHQVFHLFECSSCEKNFTENISDAAKHIASHSENDRENRTLRIEVKQVMLPMKREKLLDFNPHSHSNGIRDEMSILQQLCSSNSLTAGLNAAAARLKELETRFQFH